MQTQPTATQTVEEPGEVLERAQAQAAVRAVHAEMDRIAEEQASDRAISKGLRQT
jgi:hypothetical protein